MAKLIKLALEELEVDKVFQHDVLANKSNEFDNLYESTKAKIDKDKETPDEVVEDSDETSVEASGDDQTPSDDSELNDLEEVSVESFLIERQYDQLGIAQEDIFTKENLAKVGQVAYDSLLYIKDLGMEYGPVALKHIYKGILYVVDKTLGAISKGSRAILRYVEKRSQSFTLLKDKLTKVKETIALLKDNPDYLKKEGETGAPTEYTDGDIIAQLKIGDSVDFTKNGQTILKLLTIFFENIGKKARFNIITADRIMENVTQANISAPDKFMVENITFTGLERKVVPGYRTENINLDSYCYQATLPGDIVFITFAPKPGISDREDILSAYFNSKMFLGINQTSVKHIESCPVMTIAELETFIDFLLELCDLCISQEHIYTDVVKLRSSMRGNIKGYLRSMMVAKNKLSVKDSMAEYVSAKVDFLDKTFIAGAMSLHDYSARYITAALAYAKTVIEKNN